MRIIVELIGDLALQCQSARAKALLWGALLLLLVASVAIIKAPFLLWDHRWLAGSMAVATTIIAIVVAAGMITGGVLAETQTANSSRSQIGTNWSATRWFSLILLTLLVIPPPIVVTGIAILLFTARKHGKLRNLLR